MGVKNLLYIVPLLVVTVLGVNTASKNWAQAPPERQEAPRENRLNWYAEQARLAGEHKVVLRAPLVDYGGGSMTTDLELALAYYSLVIAQPVQQKSHVADSDTIVTWYKFKVIDPLVEKSGPACAQCSAPEAPQELFPVGPNEFLLAKNGGDIRIKGVLVKMVDPEFPPFELGKKYLLFISKYESGVAEVGLGPSGVFRVADDSTLSGINDQPHPAKTSIERRFNKSLDKLKEYTKRIIE